MCSSMNIFPAPVSTKTGESNKISVILQEKILILIKSLSSPAAGKLKLKNTRADLKLKKKLNRNSKNKMNKRKMKTKKASLRMRTSLVAARLNTTGLSSVKTLR